MASGTITGSCDNSNYTLTCEWSSQANTSANTSSVTATVYLKAPSGWSTYSANWSCTINGTSYSYSGTVGGTKVKLGQKTWTVNHNSDGSGSVNISFSYTNGLSSKGTYTTKTGSGSATVTLDKIPRVSSFSLNTTTGTLPCNFTVSINKATSSFTHTVIYTSVNGANYTKADKTSGTSVTVDCGIGECDAMPNSTSGNGRITVITYNGSTEIGRTSQSVKLYVPSSVKPTVSIGMTGNDNLGGVSVAGKSTITLTATASGSYSSTIKSYSWSNAVSGTSSSVTTGKLGAGDYKAGCTVTDSRGRTAYSEVTFKFYAYSNPWCTISAFRANSSGGSDPNGTYVRLKLNWGITNVNNNNANQRKYSVYYKQSSSSSWIALTVNGIKYENVDLSGYAGPANSWDAGGNWLTTTAYDVKFRVTDRYGSAEAITNVPTINALLNIETAGVAIGGVHQNSGAKLEVYGSARCIGNGKSLALGTGENDVYVHNSNSGKYLQLKDDGTLSYDDKVIYHDGNSKGPTQGNWFSGGFPRVGTNGVMEIGAYIDFHNTNTTTSDFSTRLSANGDNKNTVYLPTGSGTLSLDGHTHSQYLGNSGSQTINVANGKFAIAGNNNRGHIDVQGAFHTRGDSQDIWFERNLMPASWENTNLYIGYSDKRWKMVYATNGTIQTSDKRHKAIIDNMNNEDCFNMVKNTDVYSYVMLDKSKDEMTEFERIETILMNSGNEENIQMGIMAQDILNYDCSKYILTHSEFTDEETGEQKDYYGINDYAFTSSIMAALKHEIELRDKQIELLEERIAKLEALIGTNEQ